MSTFTPPANATEVGGIASEASPLCKRFMRTWAGTPRARNVWIIDGTTVTESYPVTTYNSDGSIATYDRDRVTRFFQGSTANGYSVNATEVSLLTTAGYGSNIV